jgi:hypothetical protein
MKERRGANTLGLALERSAMSSLRLFERLDALKMAVDQRCVRQRPQMLSGLQFWGVGRQEEQVHMVRHAQALGGVPAGAVEDQDNLLGGTRPRLARKGGKFGFKERDTDARGEMKQGAS